MIKFSKLGRRQQPFLLRPTQFLTKKTTFCRLYPILGFFLKFYFFHFFQVFHFHIDKYNNEYFFACVNIFLLMTQFWSFLRNFFFWIFLRSLKRKKDSSFFWILFFVRNYFYFLFFFHFTNYAKMIKFIFSRIMIFTFYYWYFIVYTIIFFILVLLKKF